MKLKSILYKKEQNDLVDKIINILELDNMNSIVLYNLDNDETKQYKIKMNRGKNKIIRITLKMLIIKMSIKIILKKIQH